MLFLGCTLRAELKQCGLASSGWTSYEQKHTHTHTPTSRFKASDSLLFSAKLTLQLLWRVNSWGQDPSLSHTHSHDYLILLHIIIPNAYSMSFSTARATVKARSFGSTCWQTHTHAETMRGGGELWDTGRKEVKHPEIQLRATWELWGMYVCEGD